MRQQEDEWSHWGSLNDQTKLDVILPVAAIPLGSRVRKITGTKTFILTDRIKISHADQPAQEILADESARFLVGGGSTWINAVGKSKMMVWEAPIDKLMQCLGETPQ